MKGIIVIAGISLMYMCQAMEDRWSGQDSFLSGQFSPLIQRGWDMAENQSIYERYGQSTPLENIQLPSFEEEMGTNSDPVMYGFLDSGYRSPSFSFSEEDVKERELEEARECLNSLNAYLNNEDANGALTYLRTERYIDTNDNPTRKLTEDFPEELKVEMYTSLATAYYKSGKYNLMKNKMVELGCVSADGTPSEIFINLPAEVKAALCYLLTTDAYNTNNFASMITMVNKLGYINADGTPTQAFAHFPEQIKPKLCKYLVIAFNESNAVFQIQNLLVGAGYIQSDWTPKEAFRTLQEPLKSELCRNLAFMHYGSNAFTQIKKLMKGAGYMKENGEPEIDFIFLHKDDMIEAKIRAELSCCAIDAYRDELGNFDVINFMKEMEYIDQYGNPKSAFTGLQDELLKARLCSRLILVCFAQEKWTQVTNLMSQLGYYVYYEGKAAIPSDALRSIYNLNPSLAQELYDRFQYAFVMASTVASAQK